ncbi:MAG: RNA methyltransferase [Crocinitomicaceae bacterium]|nr:RNA methyltransferase [Crocinitomicaceae bacterium]
MHSFNKILLETLYGMITPSKIELFERLAPQKTNYLTIAMENIYQEHNASAVMRTCESLGIQSLHIIEKDWKYQPQRDIARGAGKWIDSFNYNDASPTLSCINHLKEKGYQIVATTPHKNDFTIENLPLDKPIALFFGTEGDGISQTIIDHADQFVKIPMHGFTESLNVSVAVAVSLYTLRTRIENSAINWQLSDEEITALKIKWCRQIIPHGEKVVPEIIKRLKNEINQ